MTPHNGLRSSFFHLSTASVLLEPIWCLVLSMVTNIDSSTLFRNDLRLRSLVRRYWRHAVVNRIFSVSVGKTVVKFFASRCLVFLVVAVACSVAPQRAVAKKATSPIEREGRSLVFGRNLTKSFPATQRPGKLQQ